MLSKPPFGPLKGPPHSWPALLACRLSVSRKKKKGAEMARRGFESLEEMEKENRRLVEESAATVTPCDPFDSLLMNIPNKVWGDLGSFGRTDVRIINTSYTRNLPT